MRLEAGEEVAGRHGLTSAEVPPMLRFFNELGLVMYHSEPALKHLVILDTAAYNEAHGAMPGRSLQAYVRQIRCCGVQLLVPAHTDGQLCGCLMSV